MINLYSPLNNLGYGVHSQSMLKAFMDKNINVNLTIIGQVQEDTYYRKYWSEATKNLFDRHSPSLQIFHSSYANQFTGSPTISFAVFETTKLLPVETHHLKNTVDMIFTTTKEHKSIIESNGITTPTYVIHEGVDPFLYNTKECTPLINTGKFTFITAGKHESRKNTDMIIRAFIDTMQYNEAALIAHTFDPFYQGKGLPWTDINIEALGFKGVEENNIFIKFSNGVADLYLTKPGVPTSSMRSLYRSANAGIFYSKAEGWDLPLIECMACGIPCVASNVIGHKEYLKDSPKIQQELIIEPTGKEVANDGHWFKGDRGEWYTLSKNDLCDAIEDVYDDRATYEQPDIDLSKFYHDNYNWSLAVDSVITRIDSKAPRSPLKGL
jgi:glycosyltransferase involved in cell wall biosynthesis